MTDKKLTLGQAIDQVIQALEPFDSTTQQTIISAVSSHLQLKPPPTGSTVSQYTPNPTAEQPKSENSETRTGRGLDIRALKHQKNPKTAQEMACLVAYYLEEIASGDERKDSISTDDLKKYFKQGGYKIPTAIQQVLPDGKSSGYFEGKGGTYKLTPVGYNLVVHTLPRTKKAS